MILSPFQHLDNHLYMHPKLNTLLALFKQAAIRLCFHNLYLHCQDAFLALDVGFHISFQYFSLIDLNYFFSIRPFRILLLSTNTTDLSLYRVTHLFDPQANPDLSQVTNKNVDKTESNAQPHGRQTQTTFTFA